MPYSYPSNVPDSIKNLPAAAQKLWIAKFNEIHGRTGDEEQARVGAWGMVKRAYVKQGEKWIKREGATDETVFLILEDLGAKAPEWVRILRLGENKLADGRDPFIVDEKALGEILAAFKARGNDLVVDYEHSTMKDDGREAPAAGWVKELQARDDGLWARVEWNSKAKAFIEAKEYRYFSPVVSLTKKRHVKEILNVALTNFPALAGIDALAARFNGLETGILAGDGEAQTKTENLKQAEEHSEMEKIKDVLGLPADASEVDVILALKALKEKAESVEGLKSELATATERATKAEGEVETAKTRISEVEALSNKVQMPMMITAALELAGDSSVESALGKIDTLKVQVADGAKAKEELMALRTEIKDREAKHLLDWATERGRTTPAELAKDNNLLFKMASENTAAFKAIMDSRPDGFMAPVGSQLQFAKDEKGQTVILDEKDKEMCKAAGIPEDEYLKAKTELVNMAGKAA